MVRRLFTILSLVSLLLCVATCALWVRSYWAREAMYWRSSTSMTSLHVTQGEAVVGHLTGAYVAMLRPGFGHLTGEPFDLLEITHDPDLRGGHGFYVIQS